MLDYARKVIASYSNIKPSERFRKKCQDTKRDYSDLPDIFTFFNGEKVQSVSDFERRKEEIIDFYAKNVYSPIPNSRLEVNYVLKESGEYNGYIRDQVELVAKRNGNECKAYFLIYRPNTDKKVPVIIALNSGGNHQITKDPAVLTFNDKDTQKIEKERGKQPYYDVDRIVRSGVSIITCNTKDLAPDSKDEYMNGFAKLFSDLDDISAISLWALGNKLMIDYVESCDCFDKEKIVVFGHSRLGKTALWTAANDKRIKLAILNDSGCMGTNLCRGSTGETTKLITDTFPHWFSKNFLKYALDPSTLPVDQHMLLGSIAPRKVYVANGKNDLCADPQGSFNSLQFSLPAFKLYGLKTINTSDHQPNVNTCEYSESVAYHLRDGAHNVLPIDWDFYLDYINKYL